MYGNPETTTGGRALKFYASVRIDVRKSDTLKDGSTPYGTKVKCKIVKNKVAPPFKVVEFEMIYGKGISKSGEIVDMGIELGIIEKSGSWFSFEGQRIGQGKDNARKFLEDTPDAAAEIERLVREKAAAARQEEKTGESDEDGLDIRLLEDENGDGLDELDGLGGDEA
jgi:recombination protein RecA